MGNSLWVTSQPVATTSGDGDCSAVTLSQDQQNGWTDVGSGLHEPLELIILGTGAGATCVYSRQSSSSFVVVKRGEPVLLCDLGYGVTAACQQLAGRIPPHLYISHNHGDHSGELPVVLAQERAAAEGSARGPLTVYSHPDVMAELLQHRLRELRSTGHPPEYFAAFREASCDCLTAIGDTGLAVRPFRSRHSETCYGLVLYDEGRPFLGWTADSGYDEALYGSLAEAPLLLVDARLKGSEEHAGFNELHQVSALPALRGKTLYVTGYGRQDEAPNPDALPQCELVLVARPGMRITT